MKLSPLAAAVGIGAVVIVAVSAFVLLRDDDEREYVTVSEDEADTYRALGGSDADPDTPGFQVIKSSDEELQEAKELGETLVDEFELTLACINGASSELEANICTECVDESEEPATAYECLDIVN